MKHWFSRFTAGFDVGDTERKNIKYILCFTMVGCNRIIRANHYGKPDRCGFLEIMLPVFAALDWSRAPKSSPKNLYASKWVFWNFPQSQIPAKVDHILP